MFLQSAYLTSFLCLALLPASATCSEAFPVADPPRTDRYGDPLPDGAIFRVGTNRLRHRINYHPPFGDVLFSANGQFLFSHGHNDGGVRKYEAVTGREVHHFAPEVNDPTIALSADGSQLAVSDGNKIYLYDTATGNKQRTIDSPPALGRDPYLLCFSRDGKILTAFFAREGDNANRVKRWETVTGKKLEDWQSNSETPLALSPNSGLMASMTEQDHILRLWDVATRKKLREWKAVAHVPDGDRCTTFSPDGRSLATADEDAMIRVYDTDTGKEIRSWKGRSRKGQTDLSIHFAVSFLSFAPDGKSLASVDGDGVLRLWDWTTGRELRHFENVHGPVTFSADGKIMAAGGADGRVRLWEVATGRDLCPFADPDAILKINFSPDARVLYVGSDRPQVRLLDAASGRPLQSYPGLYFMAVSPDGGSFLVWYKDGSLHLHDATTGKERTRIQITEEDYPFRGWNAEKKLLVTGDGLFVRVWDTTTGKMRCEIRGNKEYSPRYCSPDGRIVAVREKKDGKIRLFATDTGKELRPLTGCSEDVHIHYERNGGSFDIGGLSPVFSANGKFLLAGCDRNSFGVWDVASSERILRWKCSELVPVGVSFSHDGKWLTLADTHGDPCLVDVITGRLRHRLAWKSWDNQVIHRPANRAFSADDRLLAVAHDEKTIVLWETATGQPIRTWPGHGRGELLQMVFSSDNCRLATRGRDGTALVWDVTGLSPDGKLPSHKLTAAEKEQAWHDLAGSDAAKAHRAIWTLVADPERALTLCREHLHAIPEIGKRRLTQLMADLDSEDFKVRDTARRELRKHGELARSALREALTKQASLELRRTARGLLDDLDSATLSAESLRQIRAVAVLEYLSNEEARQLLGVLEGGSPEARQTQEAKASLARLRFGQLRRR